MSAPRFIESGEARRRVRAIVTSRADWLRRRRIVIAPGAVTMCVALLYGQLLDGKPGDVGPRLSDRLANHVILGAPQ